MADHAPLPNMCKWWEIGQPTVYPAEDELFLQSLAGSGVLTFIGPSNAVGAVSGNRNAMAIHRGRGKRWHLSFGDDRADLLEVHVTNLPSKASLAAEWLNGGSLESLQTALPGNEW